MKKKIFLSLIILLFSVTYKSISQPQVINWYRITKQSPPLNYNPTVTTNTFKLGYYNINPINGGQHVWEPGGGSWAPTNLFASGGAGGSSTNTSWTIGPNNSYNSDLTVSPERYGAIHADQTIAQRYGSLANQVVAYYNYLLTYDTAGCFGNLPAPGSGLPNLSNCGYYTQSSATSWINGIGGPVTAADHVDWAAWQVCIKMASQRSYDNGGSLSIFARGPVYYIGNRAIVLPTSPPQGGTIPTFPNTNQEKPAPLTIEGNYSRIVTTGITRPTINIYNNSFTAYAIFFRETRHLATLYNGGGTNFNRGGVLMTSITINNLTLECTSPGMGTFGNNGTTVGISLGSAYSAYYCGIKGKNLSMLILTRFQLKTIIKNCSAIDCRDGFYLGSGDWGADASDSQSNISTVSDCIYENNTPNGGARAFTFLFASGCSLENCIIKGTRIRNGIYLNSNLTVNKDFGVSNIEFDVNVIDSSAIYIRATMNNIFTVINVKSNKPAIMVGCDPVVSSGGTPAFTIVISNVTRWIGVPGAGGTIKYFENNLRDSRWVFKYNDGGLHPTNVNIVPIVQSWFRGTYPAPTNCTSTPNAFPNCSAASGGAAQPRFAMYPIPR